MLEASDNEGRDRKQHGQQLVACGPGSDGKPHSQTHKHVAKNAKEEGVKITLEIIEQLKEIDGIHGIHIMAVAWEDIVPVIAERAGLLPRPIL